MWLQTESLPTEFASRAELEPGRGNPSFNTGVNYKYQLSRSRDYAEVQALYTAAGLSLDADLAALKTAPRIAADPGALTYATDNIIYNGQLTVPVLTLHTTGDGLVASENEKAYARLSTRRMTVHAAGDIHASRRPL